MKSDREREREREREEEEEEEDDDDDDDDACMHACMLLLLAGTYFMWPLLLSRT